MRIKFISFLMVAVLSLSISVSQAKKTDLLNGDPKTAKRHETQRLSMEAKGNAAGELYLFEKDGFLIIGNNHLATVFHADTLELATLADVTGEGRLIAEGSGPIWKATLETVRHDPLPPEVQYKPQPIEVSSTDATKRSYSIEKTKQSVILKLKWSGISSTEEKDIIFAEAQIAARKSSKYLYWRIDVNNSSLKRGLWEVFFPHIQSILPSGTPAETSLFVPSDTGRVIREPFAQANIYKNRYPTHSRTACMQFSAIYGPKGGLFLSAQDGDGYIKEFTHECRKDTPSLVYTLKNIPGNQGEVGMNYKMPYEFVMTTFNGNWFDACQLYRDWALKQKWCSKGPLYLREDIPQWYKTLGYWILAWEQKNLVDYEEMIKPKIGDGDQTLEDIRSIAKQISVPVATHFYGWHRNRFDTELPEHLPPLLGKEAFQAQVKEIHTAGSKIVPYICGSLYDNSLPSYKQLNIARYSAKKPNGQPRVWRFYHQKWAEIGWVDKPICDQDWMCPYTEFWQNKIRDISAEIVGDYDVDGIYYDVVIGAAFRCFDPNHGHVKGGGDHWVNGTRTLLLKCREAIKAIKPDAIMASEQPSEPYIDCLDGILLSLNQGKTGNVPAFQAVYNDYCIVFGNMANNTEGTLASLPMVIGESFTSGDQLGWFNTWVMFRPGHPRDGLKVYWEDEERRKKYVDFTLHIAQLRYHAGQKFLVFGQMLKPVNFKNKLPVREGFWQWDGKEKRRFPAVMNSLWKAPDGSIGLVLCNITDDEHTVEFTLDLGDYDLPSDRDYVLIRREIDGSETQLRVLKDHSLSLNLSLQPLKGDILEIRAVP